MNSLGVGTNSPARILPIASDSSASSAGTSARAKVRRDDGVGALEEVVDDLDLLGPGAEARERVDEPLQPVLGLDDLLRRALGERVRLVVEDERPRPVAMKDVEPSVQEDAVVLERERPLRPAPRQASRSAARGRNSQYDATKRGDPRQLLVGHRRIPGAHLLDVRQRGRGQVDELEQAVHRVADLGRDQPASPGDRPVRVRGPHAGDPLGVVAVRAALEERERAEREPAHVVQRRLR